MESRERPVRQSRARFVVVTVLLIVAVISFLLVIAFVFGLSGPATVIVPVVIALATAAWAVFRLRTERAEHEQAVTNWAASEAVSAERLRIARDLHDIVSHGIGMITVRAATARHLNTQTPNQEALLEALDDVETFSRQSTLELRRMLLTLREVNETAPRHPTDNLESLPEIIAGAQRAGLRVEFRQPDLGTVSPGVQLAVCAIVREGLGNCARHAGTTAVDVALSRVGNAVTVTITDDGPNAQWAATAGAGHGLIGLHERVNSLGGTLQADPHGEGFRLEATLPEGTP